jgi:MFS family permease
MDDQTLPARAAPSLTLLWPMVAIVFLGMLTIGLPLPVLPVEVRDTLGYGAVMVGWVIGCESFATLLTRQMAGTLCDRRGPKHAVVAGLPCAALAGLFYLAAALIPAAPWVRLAVLFGGRLVLGFAESLFLTGTMTWGIARLGARNTGRVMAWQGIAMYGALGAGGPVGIAALHAGGFVAVSAVAIVVPLLALAVALPLAAAPVAPPSQGRRVSFVGVLGMIWIPGATLSLGTVAVGALTAFVALDFAANGWAGAGEAFAAFGVGFILVRLFLAHLPDRLGGRRVASVSLVIEAAGQAVLWAAPDETTALAGAFLTGIGFSLVFPSMGVEAMRRAPPEARGLAVGGFVAFFDIAIGLAGPACGVVAALAGYPAVFLAGAVCALAAAAMAVAAPG